MTELGILFEEDRRVHQRGMGFKTILGHYFARFLMVLLFLAVRFLTEVEITYDLGYYSTHKTIRYLIAPKESLF